MGWLLETSMSDSSFWTDGCGSMTSGVAYFMSGELNSIGSYDGFWCFFFGVLDLRRLGLAGDLKGCHKPDGSDEPAVATGSASDPTALSVGKAGCSPDCDITLVWARS